MFKYYSGDQVREGDRIRSWTCNRWMNAVVKRIVPDGERVADNLVCTNGGVFIEENWDGILNLVLVTPDDRVLDADYELVSRGGE